jgi:shikimate dehydrogenase
MTKRVVLIGHPVSHSLSGAMHEAAFAAAGIDATYELWDRAPIALPAAIAEVREDAFLGANVTIPHKERVVPLVDRLTEEAQATGAVNTLTREGRRLVGHNTDVAGFDAALDRLVGRQKMPRQAVVLGAGGGSRAVVFGLIRAGFLRIVVFNRHLHRAEALVKHFSRSAAHMELRAMPWHPSIIESEIAKTRLLINATSIGLNRDESPIPADILSGEPLVLDLIYSRTRFLRDAEAAGCTVMDGETMLLHQGAAAFTLWTGQEAPLEIMAAALAEARAGGLRSAEGELADGQAAVAAEDAGGEGAGGEGAGGEGAGDEGAADGEGAVTANRAG